jgi:hypothetical protein
MVTVPLPRSPAKPLPDAVNLPLPLPDWAKASDGANIIERTSVKTNIKETRLNRYLLFIKASFYLE